MELESIDAQRMEGVATLISDVAAGRPAQGIGEHDAEALRLAVAYEREQGREVGGAGAAMAAVRMIDNVFDADDAPYESAKLMVADMAFQRHAAEVLAAAERFGADGTEPKGVLGDDATIIRMVVKEDLQDDPEVKADWTAISEGRFHDVSLMSQGMLEMSVKDGMGLEEGADQWLYDNEKVEEGPTFGSRFGGRDVLDMADDEEERRQIALQELGSAWQEHVAGEPGYDFLESYEQDKVRADWFEKARRDLGMPEEEIAYLRAESERELSVEDIGTLGERRHAEMMRDFRDSSYLVEEIEQWQAKGWNFREPDMEQVPELLRTMKEAGDPRLEVFTASVAHELLADLGASSTAATPWIMETPPEADFRSAFASASQPAPLDGGLGVAVAKAAMSGHKGIDAFDEARLEGATGPDAGGYRPFRAPTAAETTRSENELMTVIQAIAYDDPTITADDGLRRAVLLLNASGLEVGGDRSEAVVRAHARAEMREMEKGPMSPNEKARTIAFDVATQEEARGMTMSNAGGVLNAARGAAIERPARELVESMGIRTLHQEKPSDQDLGMIATGQFEKVTEYHRAGLDLGMAWAGAQSMPFIDRRLDRLSFPPTPSLGLAETPGVVGGEQARGAFAEALDRAASKGIPSDQARRAPVMSKGPSEPGADYASFMASRGGDKGR